MKKTSTYLSKYASGIIIVVAMLANSFSASAEEYKSMIRYDRVWECFSTRDGKDHDTFKCMRFDGAEEINGKTYHRLVTFKKSIRHYDTEADLYTYEIVDCLEHEGYIREEEGKVFTLLEGSDDLSATDDWGRIYIPETIFPDVNDVCSECLLYDMGWVEDGCYDATSFMAGGSYSDRFAVLNVSNVEIDGEDCKIMYVCTEEQREYYETYDGVNYQWYPPIIEGVGPVDKGCLNYHEFIDWPTHMYAHNYFTRLFDMDGNVLYPIDPVVDFDYGSFSAVQDIPEESEETPAPCYDILGRRIAEPASGQLFIRGGRKHIAR